SQAVPTVDERLKLQCAPLAGDQYRTLKVPLPGKRSDQLPHLKEQVIAPDSQQEKQAQTLYIRTENHHCASQQKSTDIQEYPRIHKVPSPVHAKSRFQHKNIYKSMEKYHFKRRGRYRKRYDQTGQKGSGRCPQKNPLPFHLALRNPGGKQEQKGIHHKILREK